MNNLVTLLEKRERRKIPGRPAPQPKPDKPKIVYEQIKEQAKQIYNSKYTIY